jgi:hypothetical protein
MSTQRDSKRAISPVPPPLPGGANFPIQMSGKLRTGHLTAHSEILVDMGAFTGKHCDCQDYLRSLVLSVVVDTVAPRWRLK